MLDDDVLVVVVLLVEEEAQERERISCPDCIKDEEQDCFMQSSASCDNLLHRQPPFVMAERQQGCSILTTLLTYR